MAPNDITAELRQVPFEPFRLHVVDGTAYDIYHPDQCLVSLVAAAVGVSHDPNSPYAEKIVKIDCRLISRIEPIKRHVVAEAVDHSD